MKKAWIYCRVPNGDGSDNALMFQRHKLEKYAKENGMEITGTTTEIGNGMQNEERAGLQKVIIAAQNNEYDILLVTDLDRLSRNYKEVERIGKLLGKVKIYSASSGEYDGVGRLFLLNDVAKAIVKAGKNNEAEM